MKDAPWIRSGPIEYFSEASASEIRSVLSTARKLRQLRPNSNRDESSTLTAAAEDVNAATFAPGHAPAGLATRLIENAGSCRDNMSRTRSNVNISCPSRFHKW